jgi:hypothetical protein
LLGAAIIMSLCTVRTMEKLHDDMREPFSGMRRKLVAKERRE